MLVLPVLLISVDVWVQFYQIRPIVRAIHRLSSIDLHRVQTRQGTENFPDDFQTSTGPPFEQALRVQGELSRLTLAGVLLDTLHSILARSTSRLGLDEAIAASPEAYVAKAARFANDRDYRTMFSR